MGATWSLYIDNVVNATHTPFTKYTMLASLISFTYISISSWALVPSVGTKHGITSQNINVEIIELTGQLGIYVDDLLPT
jgi:hypothetical protein